MTSRNKQNLIFNVNPLLQIIHMKFQALKSRDNTCNLLPVAVFIRPLTLSILMDFSIHIDSISMELPILYFKGSQVKTWVKVQNFLNFRNSNFLTCKMPTKLNNFKFEWLNVFR